MVRPALPDDDLYARLELPVDASAEAVEVAWRALLKRHHPDVAGPEAADALERSKRINVAHDWLSDPALRARYDRERGVRGHRRSARPYGPARTSPRPSAAVHRHPPVVDQQVALERFLDRVAALSRDEIDRLSMAEPAPIAFAATIRRLLNPDRLAALDAAEAEVARRLPPAARDVRVLDAVLGAAREIVLADILDTELSGAFRDRVHERLMRAWEAAIGQPRYGPNSAAVVEIVNRIGRLTPGEVRALALAAPTAREPVQWPRDVTPEDDEALRVSSALAMADARAAVPGDGVDRRTVERAARLAARAAHLTVLQPAFTRGEWSRVIRAWHDVAGSPPGPNVRRA